MPGSDTADFSVTSVGFLLQMSNTPSLHDTGKSFTLCDTDNVNDFVLAEDLIDSDFLLKEPVGEVNFLRNVFSSVDLDFKNVVLLLSQVSHQVGLGVDDSPNNSAVLSDSIELDLKFLWLL